MLKRKSLVHTLLLRSLAAFLLARIFLLIDCTEDAAFSMVSAEVTFAIGVSIPYFWDNDRAAQQGERARSCHEVLRNFARVQFNMTRVNSACLCAICTPRGTAVFNTQYIRTMYSLMSNGISFSQILVDELFALQHRATKTHHICPCCTQEPKMRG